MLSSVAGGLRGHLPYPTRDMKSGTFERDTNTGEYLVADESGLKRSAAGGEGRAGRVSVCLL